LNQKQTFPSLLEPVVREGREVPIAIPGQQAQVIKQFQQVDAIPYSVRLQQ
jgi:hypothetical protein